MYYLAIGLIVYKEVFREGRGRKALLANMKLCVKLRIFQDSNKEQDKMDSKMNEVISISSSVMTLSAKGLEKIKMFVSNTEVWYEACI